MTRLTLLTIVALAAAAAAPAAAAPIRVTVTNNAAPGGLTLTPLYVGFHNGAFDAFDEGAAASPGVEALAELGAPGVLAGERLAADPASTGGVIGAPGGFPAAPVIEPSEMGSRDFALSPGGPLFLSFFSMLVPTNDLFIGNDDPTAYPVFDAGGVFTGSFTVTILGSQVWDAGTEVNDPLNGGAFVMGVDAMGGLDEMGVVAPFLARMTAGSELAALIGVTAANGDVIARTFGPDDVIATISVSQVPVPAALPLLATGLVGLLAIRRRRAA